MTASTPSMPSIIATQIKAPPHWALLERKLISLMEKGAARMKGAAWLHCLGRVKEKAMGPWNRTATRTMGRVKFASTAGGFNSHSWEGWKAKSGRTADTYFRDGMFVLHK